jgi:GT2 family glycosyltransferase
VEWLSGFCMLVRQSTFEQIGRWDEDYSFYCEDMDLSLRLRMAGMRLAFLPDQQCVHLLSASTKTTVAVKARLEISAKALFLSKHFPGSHATLLNTFKAGDYFRGRRTPERIKWWIEILKDRGATTYDSRPT